MRNTARPFFCSVSGFHLLVVQHEFVDTTQPGDAWESVRPTGRRRAYLCGVRIPVCLTRYLWTPVLKLARVFPRRIANG